MPRWITGGYQGWLHNPLCTNTLPPLAVAAAPWDKLQFLTLNTAKWVKNYDWHRSGVDSLHKLVAKQWCAKSIVCKHCVRLNMHVWGKKRAGNEECRKTRGEKRQTAAWRRLRSLVFGRLRFRQTSLRTGWFCFVARKPHMLLTNHTTRYYLVYDFSISSCKRRLTVKIRLPLMVFLISNCKIWKSLPTPAGGHTLPQLTITLHNARFEIGPQRWKKETKK